MPMEFYAEDVTTSRMNPYEAVILAFREARRINQMRLMNDRPEGEEKVTTIALRRLAEKKLKASYGEAEDGGDRQDEVSTEQTDSVRR